MLQSFVTLSTSALFCREVEIVETNIENEHLFHACASNIIHESDFEKKCRKGRAAVFVAFLVETT